tara:strand:- start:208 stop:525 length:318 start_codon:yes stop_codon:yes gene_type:complete
MTILPEELKQIKLHAGDIIIQRESGFVGLLIEKFRNFPRGYLYLNSEDISFWKVEWIKNIDRHIDMRQSVYLDPLLEEEGLKTSILVGTVEHYPNQSFMEIDDEI